jgi:prevent-host-death family protein
MNSKTVPAGKFKATCLRLMDQVKRTRQMLVVTKNGVPVVKVIPADEISGTTVMGCMKDTFKIKGDILGPAMDPDDWDASKP